MCAYGTELIVLHLYVWAHNFCLPKKDDKNFIPVYYKIPCIFSIAGECLRIRLAIELSNTGDAYDDKVESTGILKRRYIYIYIYIYTCIIYVYNSVYLRPKPQR